MARISEADMRGQWSAYLYAAQSAGFDTSGWTLRTGNGNQGVSYRGVRADGRPVPGAVHDGMHNAYLGMTRGETYTALRHMTLALRAVTEDH